MVPLYLDQEFTACIQYILYTWKKQDNSGKTSTAAALSIPKPSTVWIATTMENS